MLRFGDRGVEGKRTKRLNAKCDDGNSRKGRMWEITGDNQPLSGLHTANVSWQTRVGKPKLVCVNNTKTSGKHV